MSYLKDSIGIKLTKRLPKDIVIRVALPLVKTAFPRSGESQITSNVSHCGFLNPRATSSPMTRVVTTKYEDSREGGSV